MELGGNARFLVFDDADVDDAAVSGALAQRKMRDGGQACTAANRFFMSPTPSSMSSTDKSVEAVGALVVGNQASIRRTSISDR